MDGQEYVVQWFNGLVGVGDAYLSELDNHRLYFTQKKAEADARRTATLQQIDYDLGRTLRDVEMARDWLVNQNYGLKKLAEVNRAVRQLSIDVLSGKTVSEVRALYEDGVRKRDLYSRPGYRGKYGSGRLWQVGGKTEFLGAIKQMRNAAESATLAAGKSTKDAERVRARALDKANDEYNATVTRITTELQRREAVSLANFKQATVTVAVPARLQRVFDGAMGATARIRNAYTPATAVPQNVTVGNTFCDFGFLCREPDAFRFVAQTYGKMSIKNIGHAIAQPFTVNLSEGFALFFRYAENGFDAAMSHVQNICLTSLLAMPPGQLKFHFVDSGNAAQTFALFKNFERSQGGYSIIEDGIQVTESAIASQLQTVVDHIRDMNVNTFRNVYPNITEYNKANRAFPQPYFIVGVMGYPFGFNSQAKKLLAQIIAGGRKCGVYVVVMADQARIGASGPAAEAEEAAVMKDATCYDLEGSFYRQVSAPRGTQPTHDIRVAVHPPMPMRTVLDVAQQVSDGVQAAGRLLVKFGQIAPRRREWFKARADEGFSVPIAMTGASEFMRFEVGQRTGDSHHMLVCGTTGSGKTRLLQSLIFNTLLTYDPADLDITLVDFKEGVEFKVYSDYTLPVFRTVALDASQAVGLLALRDIRNEVERRGKLFKTPSVSNLRDYNASVPVAMRLPRMLVILDEFHLVFAGGDPKKSAEAGTILNYLLTDGRSFGVHVILCTQSMQGVSGIAENAMQQLGIRIALKCSSADAAIVLGDASDGMRLISANDPGSAIIVPNYTNSKEFKLMRVGVLSNDDEKKILSVIEAEYRRRGIGIGSNARQTRVLVSSFEGTRGNPFQDFVHDGAMRSHPLRLHLGEAVDMCPTFAVKVAQKEGENILVASDNLDKLGGVTFFAMLDLAIARLRLRRAGAKSDVEAVFFDTGSGPGDSAVRVLTTRSAATLVDYVAPSDALAALTRIHASLGARPPKTATWLVFANLNFMDMLSAGAYASNTQGFAMLEEILREGPAQMVHTLACTDDLAVFGNLYPSCMTAFGRRIGFDLPDDQARGFVRVDPALIRDDAAALWASGTGTELFRPFRLPERPWQKQLFDRFKTMA